MTDTTDPQQLAGDIKFAYVQVKCHERKDHNDVKEDFVRSKTSGLSKGY